jgi:hypothetical protein
LIAVAGALVSFNATVPPRLMENLGRGVVAVRTSGTEVYIGWRLLGTDPADIAFNVYRATDAAAPVKLNNAPLAITADFIDTTADLSVANAYAVASGPGRHRAGGERAIQGAGRCADPAVRHGADSAAGRRNGGGSARIADFVSLVSF